MCYINIISSHKYYVFVAVFQLVTVLHFLLSFLYFLLLLSFYLIVLWCTHNLYPMSLCSPMFSIPTVELQDIKACFPGPVMLAQFSYSYVPFPVHSIVPSWWNCFTRGHHFIQWPCFFNYRQSVSLLCFLKFMHPDYILAYQESHPYLAFIEQLRHFVSVHSRNSKVLYPSCICFLLQTCEMHLKLTLNIPTSSCIWGVSSRSMDSRPFPFFDLPYEIQDFILSFVDPAVLLSLCCCSKSWCAQCTCYTHHCISLRLSNCWPDELPWNMTQTSTSQLPPMLMEYFLATEVTLVTFVIWWGLDDVITSICFENWPALCVCFFYHLLPWLCIIRIESTYGMYVGPTHISYPYILPPSVIQVSLNKCCALVPACSPCPC